MKDYKGIDLLNLLFDAIKKGDQHEVAKWFSSSKLSDYSYNNWSPLHEAVIQGQTEIVWDLLNRYGFDADDNFELEPSYDEVYGTGNLIKDDYDFTYGSALTLALSRGYMGIAEALIRNGANVNRDFYGSSSNSYDGVAKFFGASPHINEGNCLLLALNQNAVSIVRLMREYNVYINEGWGRNDPQDNALSSFLRLADHEKVELLLSLGADPNSMILDSHQENWNALYFSVCQYLSDDNNKEKWFEIVKGLLKYGATLNYREDRGEDDTVLEIVIRSSDKNLKTLFGLERIQKAIFI